MKLFGNLEVLCCVLNKFFWQREDLVEFYYINFEEKVPNRKTFKLAGFEYVLRG